jgi:peptide-methionine (R)-S-oxide reductase
MDVKGVSVPDDRSRQGWMLRRGKSRKWGRAGRQFRHGLAAAGQEPLKLVPAISAIGWVEQTEMYSRRQFFGVVGTAVGVTLAVRVGTPDPALAAERFEITRTDAQWRAALGPERYAVLRQEATEPAGSSALNHEKRRGTFVCAGCDLPLFKSNTKFESGTGWPSFYAPIRGAVRTRSDRSLGMVRTEVHCRRCGGHLGHVFDDGPPPTGKRYCMNGLSLKFQPG